MGGEIKKEEEKEEEEGGRGKKRRRQSRRKDKWDLFEEIKKRNWIKKIKPKKKKN